MRIRNTEKFGYFSGGSPGESRRVEDDVVSPRERVCSGLNNEERKDDLENREHGNGNQEVEFPDPVASSLYIFQLFRKGNIKTGASYFLKTI